MREVQFVGEIDIELKDVIGSTAFLGRNLVNDDVDQEQSQLVIGGIDGALVMYEYDENDSMVAVFNGKDYGVIASINQTSSGDVQWLVVLCRDGLLSITQFGRGDDGKSVIENLVVAYDIVKNSIMMELIDNHLMIQLSEGRYHLYSLDSVNEEGDEVLICTLVRKWDIKQQIMKLEDNESIKVSFSNLTKTRQDGRYVFSLITHVESVNDPSFRKRYLIFLKGGQQEFLLKSLSVSKTSKTAPHFVGELQNQQGNTFICAAERSSLDVAIFTETPHYGVTCCGQLVKDKNGLALTENKVLEGTLTESIAQESTCIEAPIIAVSKLDVLKDGNEELVICTDNGLTYIISTNPNQDIIKYHHRRGIRYLIAGQFGASPCFVYLTCRNHVQVFRSVQLPWLSSKGILERIENDAQISEFFRQNGCTSSEQKRDLMKKLLYC